MLRSASGYHITAARFLRAAKVNRGAKRLRKPRFLYVRCCFELACRVSFDSNAAPRHSLPTGRKFIHAKPNGDSVSLETRSIRPLRGSWHAADCWVPDATSSAQLRSERATTRVAVNRVHVAVCARSRRQEKRRRNKKKSRPRNTQRLARPPPSGFFRVAPHSRKLFHAACRCERFIKRAQRQFSVRTRIVVTRAKLAPRVRTVNNSRQAGL